MKRQELSQRALSRQVIWFNPISFLCGLLSIYKTIRCKFIYRENTLSYWGRKELGF